MLEFILLGLFSIGLLACVISQTSIIFAMILGYIIFFGYGIYKKYTFRNMVDFSIDGINTVKNILITFALIGTITAVWRSCGTIAYIVYYATNLCSSDVMILITFLLCCFISFLTGTSFGSAATMGVICITVANSMGINPIYTGGAILAGVFFGDRCSPMSTSALLVCELTDTDIFKNIVIMVKTSLVPFTITCVIYLVIGWTCQANSEAISVQKVFAENYNLSMVTIIPAVIIILFSLFKISVKSTLSVSCICAILITAFTQGVDPISILKFCIFGFSSNNASLAALMNGGGILSMVKVFLIVCISSCYAGMFKGTNFLDKIQKHIEMISEKITPFGSILLTSIITAVIACNQTLSIMLTQQLCEPTISDKETFASYLEDTAVIISPLIPWSIAGAVPIATIGAPTSCILMACFLYLVPIYNLIIEILDKKLNIKMKLKSSSKN